MTSSRPAMPRRAPASHRPDGETRDVARCRVTGNPSSRWRVADAMVTAGSDDGAPRLSGQVGTGRRTAALPAAVLDDVTADDGHLAETCGGPAEHTWPTQRVATSGHDRDEEITGSVAVVGKGVT